MTDKYFNRMAVVIAGEIPSLYAYDADGDITIYVSNEIGVLMKKYCITNGRYRVHVRKRVVELINKRYIEEHSADVE